MKHIIAFADPKHPHYRYRILYVKTLAYLKSQFPMRANSANRAQVRALKLRISKLESKMAILKQQIGYSKAKLERDCEHPIMHMEHSGYACSGTSDKFPDNGSIHEDVKCGMCGKLIHFEAQEACDEYRQDD